MLVTFPEHNKLNLGQVEKYEEVSTVILVLNLKKLKQMFLSKILYKSYFSSYFLSSVLFLLDTDDSECFLPAILPYLWNIFSTSVLVTWNVFKFPTKIRELTAWGSWELVWFPTLHKLMMVVTLH